MFVTRALRTEAAANMSAISKLGPPIWEKHLRSDLMKQLVESPARGTYTRDVDWFQ